MEPKKSPNWEGKSSSKPPFLGCMLIFLGCIPWKNITRNTHTHTQRSNTSRPAKLSTVTVTLSPDAMDPKHRRGCQCEVTRQYATKNNKWKCVKKWFIYKKLCIIIIKRIIIIVIMIISITITFHQQHLPVWFTPNPSHWWKNLKL